MRYSPCKPSHVSHIPQSTRVSLMGVTFLPPAPRARIAAVFSALRQSQFLEAFSNCGSVQQASRWAKITRTAHYNWLRDDPTYPARFEEALAAAARRFEDEAVRRAVEGTTKGIYYKGKRVAVEREYSDSLLMFILKCRNRKVFGDKSEDTLHIDGEMSVADTIRARRAARLAEEKAADEAAAKTIEVQGQIAGPEEG